MAALCERYKDIPTPPPGTRHSVWYRTYTCVTRLWNRWYCLTLDQRRDDLGEYEAAIPDLEADLAFSQEQSFPESIALVCMSLSLCYHELGQKEQALQLASRAAKIATRRRKASLQAIALRCLAEHCPKQRRDLLSQALVLARQGQRPLDEAACLLSLAGMAENEDECLRLWNQGTRILQRIDAIAWLENAAPHNPPRIVMIM